MGDLPVGKSERLGLGEFFCVQWRHGEIKVGIVSRIFGGVARNNKATKKRRDGLTRIPRISANVGWMLRLEQKETEGTEVKKRGVAGGGTRSHTTFTVSGF
jgi:hypothetical protein